jgi:hypothetical protein
MAHRSEMQEDLLVFAFGDPTSWAIGVFIAAAVLMSLSRVFDGELQESCARIMRVALSDRETSLDGNNAQLGSCRDSMHMETEAHAKPNCD